ncbi:MAG TPA: hypothetical protein VH518_03295 [Tepidisphaeraceae bacterium]|jgi:anti-sigma factor RsiW
MRLTRDELEYCISQYIDGTLAPIERPAVEERLATDPEAREILAEYQRLNTSLKTSLPPVPNIAWDTLTEQIQTAIAAEEAPVRHYSIRSIGWVRGLAAAAAVLMVVSVAAHFLRMPTTPIAQPVGVAVISGPRADVASSDVLEQIQIGPSPSFATDTRSAEEMEIVSRPTVVLIDRAASQAQDSDSGLY